MLKISILAKFLVQFFKSLLFLEKDSIWRFTMSSYIWFSSQEANCRIKATGQLLSDICFVFFYYTITIIQLF